MKTPSIKQCPTHGSISRLVIVLLFSAVMSACASTYPRPQLQKEAVELEEPRFEIPEPLLFDVRIKVFDPGKLPKSMNASRGLSEKIRKTESAYVAVELKKTLESAGRWGAVRVVPAEHAGDELLVTGCILKSNGEELKLEVTAVDARGRAWFEKKSFRSAVSEEDCTEAVDKQCEVFQSLYNQIANELAAAAQELTIEETLEVRKIAEMRFAEELVPSAFSDYLVEEKRGSFGNRSNLLTVDRLPSEEDEFMGRVQRIRVRDDMLIDALDAHYESLHREVKPVYLDWRKTRVIEMNLIRKVDDKKNAQVAGGFAAVVGGALLGAAAADSGGYNPQAGAAVGALVGAGASLMVQASRVSEESEINKVQLEELGISFGAEVEPITLEVEGETVQLTGTAESQYAQWRELLAVLYKVETEGDLVPLAQPLAE
ncbi:MAG: hypothetical protein ACI82F_001777 [Planctomycetota bacterium]|jgi:hypothetical protein